MEVGFPMPKRQRPPSSFGYTIRLSRLYEGTSAMTKQQFPFAATDRSAEKYREQDREEACAGLAYVRFR
jgi:hypothetical protein